MPNQTQKTSVSGHLHAVDDVPDPLRRKALLTLRNEKGEAAASRRDGFEVPAVVQAALQSFVKVGAPEEQGTGFIVLERYIITAAHCLPEMPDPRRDPRVAIEVRPYSGGEGTDPMMAAVVFVDPIADVAVLDSNEVIDPVNTELLFDFVLNARSLPLLLTPPSQRFRGYVYTSDGQWLSGMMEPGVGHAPFGVSGGTSGAPVLDSRGRAFGVVSSSGGAGGRYDSTEFGLLDVALPGILLGEARRAGFRWDGRDMFWKQFRERARKHSARLRSIKV